MCFCCSFLFAVLSVVAGCRVSLFVVRCLLLFGVVLVFGCLLFIVVVCCVFLCLLWFVVCWALNVFVIVLCLS